MIANPLDMQTERLVRVAHVDQIDAEGCLVVEVEGATIALFRHAGDLFAVDNRCPHMGFPLSQGSVNCGILTCHWHHARFDLASGGTFDPWADDVRAYPVRVTNGEVFVDLAPSSEPAAERYSKRLSEGMRRNLSIIIAKSVIGLHASQTPDSIALEVGAEFGVKYARNGWGSGLTILTAMANILPALNDEDRPRALYQGLVSVARQVSGQPPAFMLEPLETSETRPAVFKAWFRDFLEVRDRDAAERTLQTAINADIPMDEIADIMLTAATDHVYVNGGHTIDFINKAFELLDLIGWEHAKTVLPSLVSEMAGARRSEESSGWRHPIDLVELRQNAEIEFRDLLERGKQKAAVGAWTGRPQLVETLLEDDPRASVGALKAALSYGATGEQLASAVTFAAARRIAHFRTSNEFGDWITVLHTFTYANAIHQAMRRAPSVSLLRGVFDAALSVYLDRFLNTPPTPLPRSNQDEAGTMSRLLDTMNTQMQVAEAARQTADWLAAGHSDSELMATFGRALLREDAEFHTFQMVEAGFRQYADLKDTPDGALILIAIARYLAAHSPTARATGRHSRPHCNCTVVSCCLRIEASVPHSMLPTDRQITGF